MNKKRLKYVARERGAEINVYAYKSVIVETVVNGINRYVKQTGELPFAIPVN